MNLNAPEFVPSPKMAVDTSLQRESQIRFLEAEIEHNQARLSAETADLVVFHENLKLMHTELVYETTRTNNEEPYCWSQGQVDAFCVEFKRQADDYTVRNSASHDLASHLVSLQQRLRAVLLKPVAIPSPKHNIGLNLTGRGRLDKIDSINMNRPFTTTSISASTLPPIVEEDVPSGASLQPHPQQQPQAKNNQFAKPKKTTHE
mmetsp:Transcript_16877/g.26209  ORF Transcript_16877/g.26209 Transcript_16877/m.26209 type:complete len:204 (-) Transcript_16877:390-1001(-)